MDRREISFDGHKVTVEFTHPEASDLLAFLFSDLPEETSSASKATFLIEKEETPEHDNWKLSRDGESLFTGECIAGLGAMLLGDVLFHLICDNRQRLAIHAGLVSDDNGSILIPGVSGSGKTSVTTWLLKRGMRYHTDELVTIDLETGAAKAFTRPLNVKTCGVSAIQSIVDLDAVREQLSISPEVTMIPHRLVNPDFKTDFPDISRIIFPVYVHDSDPELIKLTGAETGLELMRSNVIARNLPAHGFNDVTRLARKIPAYRVRYRHYDDLPALLEQIH